MHTCSNQQGSKASNRELKKKIKKTMHPTYFLAFFFSFEPLIFCHEFFFQPDQAYTFPSVLFFFTCLFATDATQPLEDPNQIVYIENSVKVDFDSRQTATEHLKQKKSRCNNIFFKKIKSFISSKKSRRNILIFVQCCI